MISQKQRKSRDNDETTSNTMKSELTRSGRRVVLTLWLTLFIYTTYILAVLYVKRHALHEVRRHIES